MASLVHDTEAVVIDNGTSTLKVGFAGADSPLATLSSSVNYAQQIRNLVKSMDQDELYAGVDASSNDNSMASAAASEQQVPFQRPIRRGMVEDWDSMASAWSFALHHELNMDQESLELPVCLTDSPLNDRKSRERMAEIMFEQFNVPAFYVGSQAVFSLYSCGRTRGLVVECGEGLTSAVPVFEGFALPHATERIEVAGSDLTSLLREKLAERGVSFNRSEAHNSILRSIKENLCRVSLAYEEDVRTADTQQFELPDGQVISIDAESQFAVPEALFNPSMLPEAPASDGIVDIIMKSVSKCDGDLAPDLYNSIVVAGGSSMFPGIKSRLTNEVQARCGNAQGVQIITDSQRKYASWIGGSMFASLSTFNDIAVSRQEYNDAGGSIVHRKCF